MKRKGLRNPARRSWAGAQFTVNQIETRPTSCMVASSGTASLRGIASHFHTKSGQARSRNFPGCADFAGESACAIPNTNRHVSDGR